MNKKFLLRNEFQRLLDALIAENYLLLGPSVHQDAIVYDYFTNVAQLPRGMVDIQQPGYYELTANSKKSDDQRLFSWAAASQSIKPLCFSPSEVLWQSDVSDKGELGFTETLPDVKPTAVLGVRACDLAALDLQDQHFLQKEYVDPYYKQHRNALFLIAVNCSHPAETCFCVSAGDGPAATSGFDIVLTELDAGFILESGSDRGQAIIDALSLPDSTEEQVLEKTSQLDASVQKQTQAQSRKLPAKNIASILKTQQDHSHWDDIGQRCLACGNCTAVCPTCFCHSEHDESALGSKQVSHVRQWDSCFNQNHSYIHGIIIRPESKTRYRQWMTHKFSSWVEQYGRSGCTGCGRCIAWCPVGIDVTKELGVLCGDDFGNSGDADD